MKNKIIILTLFILLYSTNFLIASVNNLKLPNGFKVEVFLNNIQKPRGLALDENGNIFIGSSKDKAYLITKSKKTYVIGNKLNNPLGIAYSANRLYISSVNKIFVIENLKEEIKRLTEGKETYLPKIKEFVSLPENNFKHHTGRYIKIDPQNKFMIVNIGTPSNVRVPKEEHEAVLLKIDLNTKKKEVFAYGVRNSVGFDFYPGTSDLFFSDNGRDMLGDKLPPDEINFVAKEKNHFGFPYIHGKNIKDPELFSKAPKNNTFTPPIYELPAHVAPLGIHFYKENKFPSDYKNKLLIAEHGSWNSSTPVGYKISMIDINPETKMASNYQTFLSGFLSKDGSKFGRPVDVLTYYDGSILFSDDFGNKIYRIYYIGK